MRTLNSKCTSNFLVHMGRWDGAIYPLSRSHSRSRGVQKWPIWDQKWPNMAGLPMSRCGPKGSQMAPNGQYNMFLTIWNSFGLILTLLDLLRQKLIFLPQKHNVLPGQSSFEQKSTFVWNGPKGSKWAQKCPKWSKICYIDHLGPFGTLLDHIGALASLPC